MSAPRTARAAASTAVTRTVIGSAWAAAALIGTGWALVATAPILALAIAAVVGGRRWRPVLPPAAALVVSQATAIALWVTRENPPPSLTKDLDPVHAGISVALAVVAAVTAHLIVRRDRSVTSPPSLEFPPMSGVGGSRTEGEPAGGSPHRAQSQPTPVTFS